MLELGPRQANHRPALPSTLTAAEQARWPSYAGTYLGASDNSRGGLVEVYLAENNLMLETGGAKQILVPIGERQYYFQTDSGERESVAFLPDGRGQVRHMMISSDAYYRIAIDGRHAPNPDLWTAYEGIYEDPSQPEPRARHQIQIRLEDGKLLVRIQGREVELTPLNNALFLSEFGLLEFLAAEDGSASTLIVQGATPYHRVNADS